MKKIIYIIAIVCLSSSLATAQADKHSTLFYGNAAMFNPAAAGMTNGDLQLFSSYRNQWGSVSAAPFKTMNFSVDGKTFNQSIKDGFVGMGLSYSNESAGDGKLVRSNINYSLNYAIEVERNLYVSFGVSAGLGQYKLGYDNFNWSTQWTGVDYDQSLYNFEPFYESSTTVFDLGTGVFVYGSVSPDVDLYGGISINNILRPDVSFINADDRLYRSISLTFHPEIRIPNTVIAINPKFFTFIQGPNREINAGAEFKYFLKESSHFTGYFDEMSLSLGTFYRMGDALLITTGFNMAGISFGAAYDLNTSALKAASNGMGGFEFYLRYNLGFSFRYGSRGSF
ncbi:MAG: type IX secretion system PorP/SprF family membrane protein [Flavobacteriales bacterium]|jgi:type IX secretion system PorP/SprF family membrane protein